ncbi:MAG: twin-arginine translocase TatA/TatE family subunit [Pseudomonadota bacterium]|nr:twin-arginine translocase TatA/TatE family subunit [Pseudomonadota bacterium]
MSLGPWEILILVALALLVFGGRGKISQIMGDFGKGLRNFKQNIKDENKSEKPLDVGEIEPKTINTTATEILEEESKKVKVRK